MTVADEWGAWRRHRADDVQGAEAEEVMAELAEVLAPSIQIMSPLGAGGMGLVYLAHDMVLKRLVAVKVLSPSFATEESARERFTQEVEAIAAITHPHVVSIYQVGELPRLGAPYFLMQYVEGTTLRAEVRPGEIVPEAKVRRIVGEVAMALSSAHTRGLVHRDIKPANIMLERESGRALVVDFGISATVASWRGNNTARLSTPGMFVGTPAYMSPEQATGEDVTTASDIYSLGIVAFELLTGRLPFTGRSTIEIMASHGSDLPAPSIRTIRPELHPQLAELVDRALRKNPRDRPSADEIARLLFAVVRSYIEWPPPGLGQLRALGARLSQTLAVAEGTGLLFFLLLMLQPVIASLRWFEGESSAFWNVIMWPNAKLRAMLGGTSVEAEQLTVDATPLWGFLLTLCLVVMITCIPFAIGRAWHLAYRVRWARRSGYPWKVIFAVGWDYRRETGALLNGTGIYALLSRRERRRLVRLRWIEQISGATGIFLGAVTPLLWFLTSPLRSSPRSGHLLSPSEALAVIAPPLLALLILMICKRPESRHRSKMLRQRVFTTRGEQPLVRPELVSSWMKSVRLPAAPPPRRIPAAATAGLLIALVMTTTGIVGALFLSALPTIVATARARAPAAMWLQSFRVDSLRPLRWQELDQMLPPHRTDPGTSAEAATAARTLLMTPPRTSQGEDSLLRMAPSSVRLARILSRPRMRLNEAEASRVMRDAARAEVVEWRRVARFAPFAAGWYLHNGRLPVKRPRELLRRQEPLREIAAVNASAAVLALQGGDTVAARQRIIENMAMGTELLRTPFPGWQAAAIDMLRDARTVARTAGGALESGDAARGAVLDDRLRKAKSDIAFFELDRQRLLMADPRSPPGLRMVADTTLSPAVRWWIASAALTGFCHNGREILNGTDRRREALLDSSVLALTDVPGSADWIELHRRWLAEGLPAPSAAGGEEQTVRARGLLGFPGRLRFCGAALPTLSHDVR